MPGETAMESVLCGMPKGLLAIELQRQRRLVRVCMKSRICKCCGEPMPEQGNARSRNPNICASCSSLADGMQESSARASLGLGHIRRLTPPAAGAPALAFPAGKAAEPATRSGRSHR